MAKTLWLENDTGQYLKMKLGSVLDAAIDYYNRLNTNEEISSVAHTVTSGDLTIQNEYPFSDRTTHGPSHMAVAFLKPNAIGVHTVKVTATTNQGRTLVHNYQIISSA